MSFSCRHSHLSYTQWRIQVFRNLFNATRLQPTSQGAGNVGVFLHTIKGRQFSTRQASYVKRWKKGSQTAAIYEEDAFTIMEQAASRTTTSELAALSKKAQPNSPAGRPSDLSFPEGATKPQVSRSTLKSEERIKGAGKTRKQIEEEEEEEGEEEEAAFRLEDAAKRDTGGGFIASPQPTNPPFQNLTSACAKPDQSNERYFAPFSDSPTTGTTNTEILQSATSRIRFTKWQPPVQKEMQNRAATNFLEGALKRVLGDPKRLGDLGAENRPNSRHVQYTKATASLAGNETSNTVPGEKQSPDNGDQMQEWFRKMLERAKSHNGKLESSESMHDPAPWRPPAMSTSGVSVNSKSPRHLEPWKFRARRTFHSMARARAASWREKASSQCRHCGVLSKEAKNISSPSNRSAHTDSTAICNESSNVEVGAATSKDAVTQAGPELHASAPISVDRSESGATDAHERRMTERWPRGVLLSSEREQLSSLVASLRKQEDGQPSDHEANGQPATDADTLPVSPYQRLHKRKRNRKAVAGEEALSRLWDNPYAEWLASPIRRCQATGTRLPKKLMVGWNYVVNPANELVYLMPEELTDTTHLDGVSMGAPINRPSDDTLSQESLSNDAAGDMNSQQPRNGEAGSQTVPQGRGPGEQSEVRGPHGVQAVSSKANGRARLAKVYMRPSYILLLELNEKMLTAKERQVMDIEKEHMQNLRTRLSAVNQLVPPGWKEKARKFEQTMHGENRRLDVLSTAEMRNVQWHPDIHNLMRSILRTRVMKALEGLANANNNQDEMEKRIIPLLSGLEDDMEAEASTITLQGIDQAILLWCGGKKEDPATNKALHAHPHPLNPSTCDKHSLRFEPYQIFPPNTMSYTNDPDRPQHDPEQRYRPVWTPGHPIPSTATEDGQASCSPLTQNPYLPPIVHVELPHPVPTNVGTQTPQQQQEDQQQQQEPKPPPPTPPSPHHHTLPVFDLPSLLGPSHPISSSPSDNPDLNQTLGLDSPKASGWVLVKGGDGTIGFKTLAHEVWRLWIFNGGQGGGGGEGGGEGGGGGARDPGSE